MATIDSFPWQPADTRHRLSFSSTNCINQICTGVSVKSLSRRAFTPFIICSVRSTPPQLGAGHTLNYLDITCPSCVTLSTNQSWMGPQELNCPDVFWISAIGKVQFYLFLDRFFLNFKTKSACCVSVVMLRCSLMLLMLLSDTGTTPISGGQRGEWGLDKFWPNYCLLRSLPCLGCWGWQCGTSQLASTSQHHHLVSKLFNPLL